MTTSLFLVPARRTVFCLALAMVAGCGGSGAPKDRPATHKVSGVVKFKGNPVVGANITFFCEEANRSAFGRTDDQGRYELMTFSSGDGAVAGKHLVTILQSGPSEPPPKIATTDSPDYQPPGLNQSTDPPKPKGLLPTKYGDAKTSGLMAIVDAKGPNKHDFDLKD
jgi:hypothetical protein